MFEIRILLDNILLISKNSAMFTPNPKRSILNKFIINVNFLLGFRFNICYFIANN